MQTEQIQKHDNYEEIKGVISDFDKKIITFSQMIHELTEFLTTDELHDLEDYLLES